MTPNVHQLNQLPRGEFSDLLPGKMGTWAHIAPWANFSFFVLFCLSVFVFSATLHSTPQPDISKSRTFFDLSPYIKPLVFCCGRREEIPGFLMRRRAGGLITSSEVSTNLPFVSPAPQPHSQKYLMPLVLQVVCMNELTSQLFLAPGLGFSFLRQMELVTMCGSIFYLLRFWCLICFFSSFLLCLFLCIYAFAF